ncbi:hypothetical protein ACFL03_15310 [Thermodesulfobacteriota bacterium]
MNSNLLRKDLKTNTRLGIYKAEKYLVNPREDFAKKACRPPKSPPNPKLTKTMKIAFPAYKDIEDSIGTRPAESGGILIGDPKSLIINCFVFDIAAAHNRTIYQPNTKFLNSVLKGRNDEFLGIGHSHPGGSRQLTSQDQRAAWSNLTSPGNPHLNAYLMPLIQTVPDTGFFEIIPYIVTCHPEGRGRVIVKKVKLEIVD